MQTDLVRERNLSLGSQPGASVSRRISTFPSKNPSCEQKSREAPLPWLCSSIKAQTPIAQYSAARSGALSYAFPGAFGILQLLERYEELQSFNLALIFVRFRNVIDNCSHRFFLLGAGPPSCSVYEINSIPIFGLHDLGILGIQVAPKK